MPPSACASPTSSGTALRPGSVPARPAPHRRSATSSGCAATQRRSPSSSAPRRARPRGHLGKVDHGLPPARHLRPAQGGAGPHAPGDDVVLARPPPGSARAGRAGHGPGAPAQPSGMVTPASASRATALPPVGCMRPTVSPSVSRRSFLGGITVVIVTGAAWLPKNANSPARGCTSAASSSMPGIRLTQPPGGIAQHAQRVGDARLARAA